MKKTNSNVLSLTCVAMSVAILAVCSWISIPALGPLVPFTLQTFAVFVISGLFDWKKSISAIVVYILLGAVGVPVFSNFKGGIAALTGPTGGYIVGFIFMIIVIQIFKNIKKGSFIFLITGMLIGLAALYTFGTTWFFVVYTSAGNITTLGSVLAMCVLPFIIPDLLKMALAVIIVNRLSLPLRKIGFDLYFTEKPVQSKV